MRKKRLIKCLISIGLLAVVIYACYFIFNHKEIKMIEIDENDASCLLANVNKDFMIQIHTVKNDYDIYDTDNNKVDTIKEYSNQILTIKPKEKYKDNMVYYIQLQDNDTFVDNQLENKKIVYFTINEQLMKQNLEYELADISIEDEYILKNKQINLGEIKSQLEIKQINKKISLNLTDYKVYIDDKEVNNNLIKTTKGKHKLKIQFDYNGKNYASTKEINIKEYFGGLSDNALITLANDYYKQAYYLNDYAKPLVLDYDDTAFDNLGIRILKYDGKKVSSKKDIQNIYYQFFEKDVSFKQAYVYQNVLYDNGIPYHLLAEGSLDGIGNLESYEITKIKKKTEDTITFNVNLKLNDYLYQNINSEGVVVDSSYISKEYNDEFSMKYYDKDNWKVSQFKMRGITR